ncbi:MAG TPA: C40 family peptidase [Actinomycetota bacterium]|nr:C40 family peptidase [Actinomycetota bacterium]
MKAAARICALALVATAVAATPAAAAPAPTPDGVGRVKHRGSATVSRDRDTASRSEQLVARALTAVGTPYSYGGTSPGGFDCSGFTMWVYSGFGITLPHSSSAQYALGGTDGYTRIASPSDLQPGDLVFQATGGDGVGHVGIYVGNGNFVSATSSEGVQVRSLYDSYWGPLWVGGVRVDAIAGTPRERTRHRDSEKRKVALHLVRADVPLVLVPLGTLVPQ